MRAHSKRNKVLDIALSEEKFCFPGETIQGSVIVKPKSQMKTNGIIIKFSGAIFIAAKEKEVLPLFQQIKTLSINQGKSKLLEVKQYSFPFEFKVPENLPSTMDLGKNKTARIHYKLSVILDRPMMPESLCPKLEYPVSVMEYVDVTKDNFTKTIEKQKEVLTSNNGKCHAKLSVPRSGYTRGETIPVNMIVNTFQSFVKKESLVIELIRKVKIQTSRNTLDEEHVLKSNKFDLNIIGPYNFTQSITSDLLIRTTPPTIKYKDRVLRVHYKIRAQLFTENKKAPNLVLELPIVIGTWPRADIPIDDDDDEDIIQNMGEVMISDEIDDDEEGEDDWMTRQEELEFNRHSSHSFIPSPSSTHYTGTSGYFTTTTASTPNSNNTVKRSGSNNSLGSISSWRSQSTRQSIATSPTTTMHSIPDTNYHQQRNTLPPVGFNVSNGYLNRSSSTPDLLSNPNTTNITTTTTTTHTSSTNNSPTQQINRTRVIDPTFRNSYYEPQGTQTNHLSNHRPTKSMHSIHPSFLNFTPVPQQHRRVGSDEYNFPPSSPSNYTMPPHSEPQVPNHTLTFLSSSTPTTTPTRTTPPSSQRNITLPVEEEDDDDDSDDDLFAIIERKKKREEREKRQRMMYT